jgi:acetyl esterase/lipase
MDVGYAEKLISATNCVIVSPDYALSTESPYPAALEDCYETLLWVKENAPDLGIRDDQLFIGGVSAGGGLTAAVTLMARDEGEVNIAFQMPLYPMLDDLMDTESAKNNNAPIWNSSSNRLGWKMYLKGLSGEQGVPKYAAPAREADYSRLPPAYTFVGDIEPFYDETVAYFENLQKAGVLAKVDVYEGCYHAFDIMCPKAGISKQATSKMLVEFRFAVENHFAPQP